MRPAILARQWQPMTMAEASEARMVALDAAAKRAAGRCWDDEPVSRVRIVEQRDYDYERGHAYQVTAADHAREAGRLDRQYAGDRALPGGLVCSGRLP